jgi:hypothetical protein
MGHGKPAEIGTRPLSRGKNTPRPPIVVPTMIGPAKLVG